MLVLVPVLVCTVPSPEASSVSWLLQCITMALLFVKLIARTAITSFCTLLHFTCFVLFFSFVGDHAYKKNAALPLAQQMISSEPDVRYFELEAGDEFLVIACDGIWFVSFRLFTSLATCFCLY